MNSNIPTPRTDANTLTHIYEDGFHTVEPKSGGSYVKADFARSLERELTEMKAVVEKLKQALAENVWPTATGTQESFDNAKKALNSTSSQLLAEHDEAVRNKVIEECANSLDDVLYESNKPLENSWQISRSCSI